MVREQHVLHFEGSMSAYIKGNIPFFISLRIPLGENCVDDIYTHMNVGPEDHPMGDKDLGLRPTRY